MIMKQVFQVKNSWGANGAPQTQTLANNGVASFVVPFSITLNPRHTHIKQTHTCIHRQTHTHAQTHPHTYRCKHTHTRTHTHTHTSHRHAQIHTYTHHITQTHTDTHTHTHTRVVCMCVHVCAHGNPQNHTCAYGTCPFCLLCVTPVVLGAKFHVAMVVHVICSCMCVTCAHRPPNRHETSFPYT